MLDSTKKNAYNIIGSKIFRKKFFFWNSAKGQFAEVVAYNIIHSKMSFENLENFDFDVWKIALSAKGQFAEVVVYNIIDS